MDKFKFIREVTEWEPDGPVSVTLLTLDDGRVLGVNDECIVLYPSMAVFDDCTQGPLPTITLYPPTAAEVGARFVRILRHTLNAEQFAEMQRLNAAEENPNICHSHDYIDANVYMMQALESFGVQCFPDGAPGMPDDAQTLWNEAWAYAMAHGLRADADTLTDAAAIDIYRETLATMQHADEIGGPDTPEQYQALMRAISAECLRRAEVCRANNEGGQS